MIKLSLLALKDNSILLQGVGRNQRLKSFTANKVPGSILLTSAKFSSSIRIYIIYDNFEGGWVFAFTNTKELSNQKAFDFYLDQHWSMDGLPSAYVHLPDDTKLTLEGEFSED